MQQSKWTGLSDDAILAELERKESERLRAKHGSASRVAWLATFLCAITLIAMVLFPLVGNRGTSDMRWLPFALIPFFASLPAVFFRLAREKREVENQIRDLCDRVALLERAATSSTQVRPATTPGQ